MATYIQGNYLVGSLPILDGTLINWNTYRANDILTVIIWIILIVGTIILIKKYKIENVAKYSAYISLAIVVMLSVSLIMSYFSNKDILFKKNGIIFTSENINDISKDKNFFIFMLDSVDAKTFNEVLNESEYKDLFNDFTFYIDAMSTYPHTRDSVPLVLTGKMNRNEKAFANFSSDALNSSPLFLNLKNKNYNINLYSTDLIWNGKRNYQVQNLKTYKEASIDLISFFKQELKYILFKYMPYNLKMFSRIETLNFDLCTEKFRWGNDIEYNNILDNPTLNKVDNNIFQFIHLEGGHVPFDLDENFNRIENGTYEEKLLANLKMIKAFLYRLKNNDSYNNSVIIFIADHGYDNVTGLARFNPILLIKGINEKHEFKISNKKISFEDLVPEYELLLNDEPSSELFKEISEKRTRKFIWYNVSSDNHMVEYETNGTARDVSKFKLTGKTYDR